MDGNGKPGNALNELMFTQRKELETRKRLYTYFNKT